MRRATTCLRRRFQHLFGLIEQGGSLRRHRDNIRLLESQFDVVRADVARTHLFSLARSPLYNNLGVYVCRPGRMTSHGSTSAGRRLVWIALLAVLIVLPSLFAIRQYRWTGGYLFYANAFDDRPTCRTTAP